MQQSLDNILKENKISFKFHHVGCAVRNMTRSIEFYTNIMGFNVTSRPYEVPSQNVRVCFLDMGNKNYLELVEGVRTPSPVEKVLQRPGGGVYHMCFQVENIDNAVKMLKSNNFLLITRYEQKDNPEFRYVFMLTPDRHLLELCELI